MKKKPGPHQHHGNRQSGTSSQDRNAAPHGPAWTSKSGTFLTGRSKSSGERTAPPSPVSLFSIHLFHWNGWRRPVNGHFTGQRKKSRRRSISPARQAQLSRSQDSHGPYDTGHIGPARLEPSQSVSEARPVMAILIRVRMTARSRSQTRPGDREREKRKEKTKRKSVVFRSHFEQGNRGRARLRVRIFCSVLQGFDQPIQI
jgi:hypothetical protein